MIKQNLRHVALISFAMVVSGCATPHSGGGTDDWRPRFSLGEVRYQCAQLGCREPNTVVAGYFADIAKDVGSACIVHIFPERAGSPPWHFWEDYTAPLRGWLADRRVRLYAYTPYGKRSSRSYRQAQARLHRLKHLYLNRGALKRKISSSVVNQDSIVLPPYRTPYCEGKPVLEIFEGARIVSEVASVAAERIRPEVRAARTVLVVLDK